MLKRIIRKIRRWRCRRQFNALPKQIQKWMVELGFDPDSLIERGEL